MSKVEHITAKYTLTREDKAELAEKISRKIGEVEALDVEKKTAANDFKARIEDAQAEVSRMSAMYRNGYDFRTQPATRELDYEDGYIRWYHAETGVLLEERRMTYEERQQQFDFDARRAHEA